MDFPRWMDGMRTRTALFLFLASVVVAGLLVFALGAGARDAGAAAGKAASAKTGKGPAVGKDLAWKDLGAGLTEAKSKSRRILVDVYTDWCGWCKRMDRDTYAQPEVQKYLRESFVPVRLNAESDRRVVYKGTEYSYRQLASGFRVTGYPTALFLEPDGTHIVSAPGYMKAPDFLSVLRYIGDGHYKDKDFQEYRAAQDSTANAAPR